MKRLLLASSGLGYIREFVKANPSLLRMLFIPTAANLDSNAWWVDKDLDVLTKMGFVIRQLDIEHATPGKMNDAINKTDIVYIAGGNTLHLLRQLRMSGFDKLLTDYVNQGGMYAGASAGAIIAGPDIAPIAAMDEPEKVSELSSTQGLGFIDIIPIPHADKENTNQVIKSGSHECVFLTDDEAILVSGNNWRVVTSKRSALELDWLHRFASTN